MVHAGQMALQKTKTTTKSAKAWIHKHNKIMKKGRHFSQVVIENSLPPQTTRVFAFFLIFIGNRHGLHVFKSTIPKHHWFVKRITKNCLCQSCKIDLMFCFNIVHVTARMQMHVFSNVVRCKAPSVIFFGVRKHRRRRERRATETWSGKRTDVWGPMPVMQLSLQWRRHIAWCRWATCRAR